jgi:hypothetical protein
LQAGDGQGDGRNRLATPPLPGLSERLVAIAMSPGLLLLGYVA